MTTGRPGDEGAADAAALLELPHDRLASDIVRHLENAGVYRVTFVPGDPQRLVDLRWAALGAGRRLGRKVYVTVGRSPIGSKAPVMVRMSCARGSARSIPLQRDREI